MQQKIFACRGATSAENSSSSIIEATKALYLQLLTKNALSENNLVSLHISVTDDLTAINPATALRTTGLASNLALFCSQEPKYSGSHPKIIRFLLYYYNEENHQPVFCYLNEAKNLRAQVLNSYHSLSTKPKTLYLVSREYAGIAEAGGLKNVVKALAQNLKEFFNITVFLPHYSFIERETKPILHSTLYLDNKVHELDFLEHYQGEVRFVFVHCNIFSEKQGIYTYTEAEAKNDPNLKGCAYDDSQEMNLVFQHAIVQYVKLTNEIPDIVHCHDGQTAFVPALFHKDTQLKSVIQSCKFFVTIHNAGDAYRQQLNYDYALRLTCLSDEELVPACVDGLVEPFLVSCPFAKLTTVSLEYANELKSPNTSPFSKSFSKSLQEKNIEVIGITNGLDYWEYNPSDTSVSKLPFAFNPLECDFNGKYQCRSYFLEKLNKNEPLAESSSDITVHGFLDICENGLYFAFHGRLVHQKGIEVLLKTIDSVLETTNSCRFIIMGQGTTDFESECIQKCKTQPGKIVFIKGYDKSLSRLVIAAADFMILPSLFEPCGLEDYIAQSYGTIPIAHATGGLNKIIHGETGFLFKVSESENKFDTQALSLELSKLLKELIAKYANLDVNYLLQEKQFTNIIKLANQKLITEATWENRIKKHYLPLYGHV